MWSAGCLIRSHALVRLTACREYLKVRTHRLQQSSTAISAPASSAEANDKRKDLTLCLAPCLTSNRRGPIACFRAVPLPPLFLPSRGYQHRVGLLQVAVGHASTASFPRGLGMKGGRCLPGYCSPQRSSGYTVLIHQVEKHSVPRS
jgi:hypothetical protein